MRKFLLYSNLPIDKFCVILITGTSFTPERRAKAIRLNSPRKSIKSCACLYGTKVCPRKKADFSCNLGNQAIIMAFAIVDPLALRPRLSPGLPFTSFIQFLIHNAQHLF